MTRMLLLISSCPQIPMNEGEAIGAFTMAACANEQLTHK